MGRLYCYLAWEYATEPEQEDYPGVQQHTHPYHVVRFFLAVKLADQIRADKRHRVRQHANRHYHGDIDAEYRKRKIKKPTDAQNIEHGEGAQEHARQHQK